jgi:hypothetical protein
MFLGTVPFKGLREPYMNKRFLAADFIIIAYTAPSASFDGQTGLTPDGTTVGLLDTISRFSNCG